MRRNYPSTDVEGLRADYLSGMPWKKLRKRHHVSTRRLSALCHDLIGTRRIDGRQRQAAVARHGEVARHETVARHAAVTRRDGNEPLGPRIGPRRVDEGREVSPSSATMAPKKFIIAYRLRVDERGGLQHEHHFKIVEEGSLAAEYLQVKTMPSLAEVYVGPIVEPVVEVKFREATGRTEAKGAA